MIIKIAQYERWFMPAMDGGEVYELFQCNDCERDRITEAEALEDEVIDDAV